MQLTKHFSIYEVTRSGKARELGLSNAVHERDTPAVLETALNMERIRAALGDNPINVNSWYRNESVNRAVGGVPNSAHRMGYAVDFTCPKFGSVTDVCRAIIASGIQFDQLIWEYGRWVHISFDPRNRGEVLHIKQTGQYRKGLPV